VELVDLATHAGLWLRSAGPDSDVVLSTRIRLARNVEGFSFPSRIKPAVRADLETILRRWIEAAGVADGGCYWNLGTLDDIGRQLLMERHLVSRELVIAEGHRGVTFAPHERLSIMTNEEDHLRIQVIRPGQCLEESLTQAIEIDRALENHIPYAFSESYGYLTSCPTNVGTGLRISVMLHVPCLVLAKQIDRLLKSMARVGLTVRGFYGEGSKSEGDIIQISNQHSLGRSEAELLGTLENMISKVVEYERGVRTRLFHDDRTTMEDRAWRAMGTLRYARRMSSDEAFQHLSAVRLGINLQMFPGLAVGDVNELLVITQPAHLQTSKGRELRPLDRDQARASLLRERFKPDSN
jgi:protein arginine kinase